MTLLLSLAEPDWADRNIIQPEPLILADYKSPVNTIERMLINMKKIQGKFHGCQIVNQSSSCGGPSQHKVVTFSLTP